MKLFLYTLLFWVAGLPAVFGQEYGYSHYDNKEGLGGSTVYCMTQDQDGFLWFGTEAGLSRFDGTRFKNFTKADGLPDNEIIQLFADSKGRLWIAPFKKSVCYYYKGRLYTRENDPFLNRIHIDDYVARFIEDEAGNILMQEPFKMHLIEANGRVTVTDSINSKPVECINAVYPRKEGGFMVVDGNKLYDYHNGRFRLRKTVTTFANHFTYFAVNAQSMIWRRDTTVAQVVSLQPDSNRITSFPFKVDHINYSFIDERNIASCTRNGAFVYNIHRPDSSEHFLPGLPVNGALKDSEGNIWFSTLGHGVYKLSSAYVLNVKLRKDNVPAQVYSFALYKGSLLASTEVNIIYRLNPRTGKPEKQKIILEEQGLNPVNFLSVYKGKYILCGTNVSLYRMADAFKWQVQVTFIVVKGICLDGDKLYVATKNNVFVIHPETWKISDTVWRERSTTVFAHNDTIYIGTLNGLYCRYPDKSMHFLGEKIPALNARITAVQKDAAGVLWVGTYGDGLIGYKNGRIVAMINQDRGLSSNICRTFYLSGNNLWVGTDKGLNKINTARAGYPVTKYTTGDGLASDIINAIYVDSNKVFVGTPEGVTFFDEQKSISQSRCDLLFTEIAIGGAKINTDSIPAVIAHEKNSVRFDYVGISYKSTGDIRYRYRLLGLDSNWKETRETFLSYPTLPSGDYQLQIQAINKFDVSSKLLTAGFTIDKLLYERTWFRILMALLFLTITGLLVWLSVRRVRQREQEKTAISKRISELEQLSRKAQMNPHFIFNSLNSIQHYVMDSDVTGANKFISGFSRLIRQTLDFSSKPEISLEEELDYLTNYLELEKTRLEDAFSWKVSIEEGVDPAEYYIPPMILQPFVENSVRHGLRFRRDKNGVVTITVKRAGDHLVCILEDNGIGRKAAMEYKSISPINYQSKGLSLTADRITMFNKEHEHKITMQIDDLEDELHNALGTKVTINFPVF
jgi:ligand-binding sensor domain-containing protein